MGVLIIVGVVALGLVVARRASGPGLPVDASVVLPAGAKLVEMTGWGNRLVLRATMPDGAERLLILDPAEAKLVGSLTLRSAP